MSPTKTVEVPEPGPLAATVTVVARGRTYTFRELSYAEYDKVYKQATHEEEDSDGIKQEVTDNNLLTRLMILKSCVEPKLAADDLNELGTKLYRGLSRVVSDLHFLPEEIRQVDPDGEAGDEKGTPKGNG